MRTRPWIGVLLVALGLGLCGADARAQSGLSDEWFDFELYRDLVFLEGRIRDEPVPMMLDSGANVHALDLAFAEELGLLLTDRIETTGTSGSQPSWVVDGLELEVGPLRLANQRVVVLDLSEIQASLGRELPIIVGRSVFLQAAVDLDYPNQRVAFRDPASLDYAGNEPRAGLLENRGGTWAVHVTLENGPPGYFQIDTGSMGTVSVFEGFTRRNQLLDGREPLSLSEGVGVGGRHRVKIGTLGSLRLAGCSSSGIPAAFDVPDHGPDPILDGALGGAFLKRYRLIMDPERKLLTLIESEDSPFRKDRVGLMTRLADTGLRVTFVRPGSPAEAAGWKEGATIVAIDGVYVEAGFYGTEQADWSRRPTGTTVRLLDSEGRESELVLAEYY